MFREPDHESYFEGKVWQPKFCLPTLYCFICNNPLFLQLLPLTNGVSYIVSNLTIDDTLYYLQIAWNVWDLGFATFDGLHATNGVQFLWFVTVLGLAAIAPSKVILLYAAMSLTVLLNVMCYAIIWRISSMLARPWLGVWISSLWMVVSLSTIYVQGMENSLHALVFWWLIAQVLAFLINLEKNSSAPNMLPLSMALIINVWARMDGALFSVILFIGCIVCLIFYTDSFNKFWSTYSRRIFLVAIFGATGFAIQLGGFWLMAETLLPISAIIKTSGLHYPHETVGLVFFEALKMSLPLRFPHYSLEIVAVTTLVVLSFISHRNSRHGRRAFLNMWWILFIAFIAYHVVVVSRNMAYSPYNSWYRSPLFIFWILTFGGIAIELMDRIKRNRRTIALVGVIGISLLINALAANDFAKTTKRLLHKSTYLTDIYKAALWVSEHTPPETVLAAWNAGILGYFSNRTTINLDGLVNSHEYFTDVLANPDLLAATQAYLKDNKVDYIIDMVETEDVRALTKTLTHLRYFTPQNGGWVGWQMWQVHHNVEPFH